MTPTMHVERLKTLAPDLARRAVNAGRQRVRAGAYSAKTKVTPRDDLLHMGTIYGGWSVPAALLDESSVCYLAGLGKDITFDLGMIARFGCTVHALDPVPAALDYAREAAAHEPRLSCIRAACGPTTARSASTRTASPASSRIRPRTCMRRASTSRRMCAPSSH